MGSRDRRMHGDRLGELVLLFRRTIGDDDRRSTDE